MTAPGENAPGDAPAQVGLLTGLEGLRLRPYGGDLVPVGETLGLAHGTGEPIVRRLRQACPYSCVTMTS